MVVIAANGCALALINEAIIYYARSELVETADTRKINDNSALVLAAMPGGQETAVRGYFSPQISTRR
jgi:hypothetical protein